jgi:hypothetical protein
MRPSSAGAYLLLDASLDFGLRYELEGRGCEYRCLLDGMENSEMAGELPYLVALERYCAATEWFRNELFGKGYGILISTSFGVEKTVRDLKTFIRVDILEDRNVFFRFYRPNVFNSFIHSIEVKKQNRILEKRKFFSETKRDKNILRYIINNNSMETSIYSIDKTISELFTERG